jgi:hypothetical protein
MVGKRREDRLVVFLLRFMNPSSDPSLALMAPSLKYLPPGNDGFSNEEYAGRHDLTAAIHQLQQQMGLPFVLAGVAQMHNLKNASGMVDAGDVHRRAVALEQALRAGRSRDGCCSLPMESAPYKPVSRFHAISNACVPASLLWMKLSRQLS